MTCWYVLTTVPQREFKAEIELERLGMKVFVPHVIRHKKAFGKCNRPILIESKVALMPSYALVKADTIPWYDVRALRDVRGRVDFDGRPGTCTEAEVQRIQQLVIAERMKERRGFKRGDGVRVTDGPFRDLAALVEEIGMGSVRISVEMFGGKVPVTIRPDQIERAA